MPLRPAIRKKSQLNLRKGGTTETQLSLELSQSSRSSFSLLHLTHCSSNGGCGGGWRNGGTCARMQKQAAAKLSWREGADQPRRLTVQRRTTAKREGDQQPKVRVWIGADRRLKVRYVVSGLSLTVSRRAKLRLDARHTRLALEGIAQVGFRLDLRLYIIFALNGNGHAYPTDADNHRLRLWRRVYLHHDRVSRLP